MTTTFFHTEEQLY